MEAGAEESGGDIVFDAQVEIFDDGLGEGFVADGNDGDFHGDDLAGGEGAGEGFGTGFVLFACDVAAEGDDALVAILIDGDIAEAGVIERAADADGDIGGFGRAGAAGEGDGGDEYEREIGFHLLGLLVWEEQAGGQMKWACSLGCERGGLTAGGQVTAGGHWGRGEWMGLLGFRVGGWGAWGLA